MTWLPVAAFLSGFAADWLTHWSIVYRLQGARVKAASCIFIFTMIGMTIVVMVVDTNSYVSIVAYALGRVGSTLTNGTKHIE